MEAAGPLPPQTPKKLELSFNVPFKAPDIKQDSHFVQREYFNKLLISQIEAGIATSTTNINQVVLYGTGGMGKTQLALNYVSCYHQNYSSVFWINAASEETTKHGFVDIMRRLINSHTKSAVDPPDYVQIGRLLGMAGKLDSGSGAFNIQNPQDEHHVVEAVKRWLATEGNTRWLLVFDNVDDLESFSLNNYIPSSCRHGTIIITSRRRECLSTRRGFEVQQMQQSEAEMLLTQSSRRDLQNIPGNEVRQEEEAIATIIQKLGYLPLALDHAGSYILKEQCSFRSYLDQLESNISFHLSRGWKQGEESVFASWEMSFEALRRQVPKATDLLSICGFLDYDEISDEFLRRGMKLENNDSELMESIHALLSYSFIQKKGNTSFSIHPLVHMWARKRLETHRGLYIRRLSEAVQIINSALMAVREESREDWNFERRHIPHLTAIDSHMATVGAAVVMDDMETVDCIVRLGYLLSEHGRYNMALEWYQRALAGYEKQLGADHPSTLHTMHNMALVFDSQGEYDMALEWYQRALAGYEKQLGADDSTTLNIVNNMAVVFGSQGRYDMALEWYQRALAGYEKQLGADDSTTLNIVNNMAVVFGSQGRYDMALEWYQRALAGYEKELGADHPSTCKLVGNMAMVFDEQGKYDMALEWYQRALAGKEKQLGADHPSTLNTVSNMAMVFGSQGRYDMALEWCQRALAGCEKQLGEDHPSTLNIVNNMAIVFGSQGRYDMALEWYQRALAGKEKQLGADHPITHTTVHNMAAIFGSQGRYDMALEWYQRALAGREKQLGVDHPSTLDTVNNMAMVFDEQGRYDMALEWYQRALAGYEKQLGVDHPTTLGTMHNMAVVFFNQGRHDMALEWYQRTLAGKEKELGADHPSTLNTVNNMAMVFDEQGRYDMALEWYQRALAGYEKQLGAEHPDTRRTVRNIVRFYQAQNMPEEAKKLRLRYPTA